MSREKFGSGRNPLERGRLAISENLRGEIELEIVEGPRDLEFDRGDRLASPFDVARAGR